MGDNAVLMIGNDASLSTLSLLENVQVIEIRNANPSKKAEAIKTSTSAKSVEKDIQVNNFPGATSKSEYAKQINTLEPLQTTEDEDKKEKPMSSSSKTNHIVVSYLDRIRGILKKI